MLPRLLPIAAALALAGCAGPPALASAPAPPPLAVATAAAELVELGAHEELSGTVRAATAATLMARVPGAVARIAATPGERVAAGALLVELDAQELAARRDQARAQAAQAAADFERARQLAATQALTKAEFDAAQARAAGSAAAAAEAEVMAGYVRIAAPFAGVVVRRHVEVGDLLTPGRPVVDLEDPASLRLEVEVPESLAGRIALGARLAVRIAAADLALDAAVAEITPAADPVSRSVLVKLALPPAAPGLRSGQFGRVIIAVAGGRALTVPSAAVVHRGQLDAVFVVADGHARLRLVRLGAVAGGRSAIRAGLAPGETVVAADADGLSDGQAVSPR